MSHSRTAKKSRPRTLGKGPEAPQPEPGRRAGPRNFGATIMSAEEAPSVLERVATGGFSRSAAHPATGRFRS